MANITLWQLLKDSLLGLYLPNTENWSEKLSIEQIVEILLFHHKTATEKDKRFLQNQMNLFAKNGGIEFDEVELYFSFRNYIKRIASLDDIDDSLLEIHSPNSVINALSHIKEGEYIELKEYCGSKCKTCKCTLIKSYYNRLPESWQIEGVHILYGLETSIKLSGCSIPMMTAKQCYNFLHSKQYYDIVEAFKLKGVTINLDNSFLKGWWEGDIVQISTANNYSDINTDDEMGLKPNTQTTDKKEKEVTQWLRETWIKEGKPNGATFFKALKTYKGQKGSPIIDYYTAGENAGIKWKSSRSYTGEMSKKTIQNKVSDFKKTSQQNTVNSKK